MGRLGKTVITRPSLRVTYKKLVDDCSTGHHQDTLRIMPSLPEYLSYCCHQCGHTQKLQAEELNSIVGNAFRMAYAAQLQKQPTFQDVIASQLDQTQTNKVLWTKELSVTLKKDKSPSPAATRQNNKNHNQQQQSEMDVHDGQTIRIAPPNTLAGLQPPHLKYNVLEPTAPDKAAIDGNAPPLLSSSQNSTPSSDESNSPTEMNTYKRMTEKPPLIKRLAMGLTGGNNHHHHHHHHDDTNEDDSCPLVVSDGGSTPGSPTNRPLSGGYVNETVNDADTRTRADNNAANNLKNGGGMVESINSNNLTPKHIEIDNNRLLQSSSPACTDQEFKTKRISQISSSSSSSCQRTIDSSTTITTNTTTTTVLGFTPIPPPLPERTDSLNNKEEGELRTAPWFQAGIPREIALEILAQEPVGAFMVRESTSKPGCFALSLRVPRSFQPTGIAHYLIVRANKGYKIKGFTKEFMTLTSLITHHSVMPELLPCPLSLSRYNPSFVRTDSKRDFADIDLDPDYNTLADFRKMMADLNV